MSNIHSYSVRAVVEATVQIWASYSHEELKIVQYIHIQDADETPVSSDTWPVAPYTDVLLTRIE